MAGNGGALLLCLNALLARQVCDWSILQPFAVLFAIGLASAFASIVLEMLLAETMTVRLGNIVASAQTAAIAHQNQMEALDEINAATQRGDPQEKVALKIRQLEDEMQRTEITTTEPKKPSGGIQAFASRRCVAVGVVCFGAAILLELYTDWLSTAMCPQS